MVALGGQKVAIADAVLEVDDRVVEEPYVDRATIDRLTSPGNYLGLAPQMVDRVLESCPRSPSLSAAAE